MARRRIDPGSLRRPDGLLQAEQSRQGDAPATVKGYAEYPPRQRKVLGDPAGRRRQRLGLSQGLVRGPEGEGGVQGQVRLRTGRAEGLQAAARHRRVLLSARSEALRRRASTPTTPTTRWRWASSRPSSATAASSATTRRTRSTASSTRRKPSKALEMYQRALQVHASGLGQGVLPRGQPGDHRGPGGDEHELLRLLPGAGEPGDQPERRRSPASSPIRQARPASSFAALGGQGISIVSYSKKRTRRRSSWSGSSGRRPAEMGGARRLHLQQAVLESSDEFRNATPYNKAFYQIDADGEGLLGDAGIRRTAGSDEPAASIRYVVGGKGTARRALDATDRRTGRRRSTSTSATSQLNSQQRPEERQPPPVAHLTPGEEDVVDKRRP